MLSSSFPHLFFIVIVARRKLWDFLPPFPRTEQQLQLRREELQLDGETLLIGKDEGAPQRRDGETADTFRACPKQKAFFQMFHHEKKTQRTRHLGDCDWKCLEWSKHVNGKKPILYCLIMWNPTGLSSNKRFKNQFGLWSGHSPSYDRGWWKNATTMPRLHKSAKDSPRLKDKAGDSTYSTECQQILQMDSKRRLDYCASQYLLPPQPHSPKARLI